MGLKVVGLTCASVAVVGEALSSSWAEPASLCQLLAMSPDIAI